jgi:hypothetical protein
MDSGDLATNLALSILSPANAVRAAEGHPANSDLAAKARRRRHPEPEQADDFRFAEAAAPPHQLDDLA